MLWMQRSLNQKYFLESKSFCWSTGSSSTDFISSMCETMSEQSFWAGIKWPLTWKNISSEIILQLDPRHLQQLISPSWRRQPLHLTLRSGNGSEGRENREARWKEDEESRVFYFLFTTHINPGSVNPAWRECVQADKDLSNYGNKLHTKTFCSRH